MIEYLKGEVTELDPTKAIIECGGVGYECNISVYTYDKIKVGQVNKLVEFKEYGLAASVYERVVKMPGFNSINAFNSLIAIC